MQDGEAGRKLWAECIEVGVDARKDIEELLGIRVMLELFVKVEKDWRDSMYLLKEYGYKDSD